MLSVIVPTRNRAGRLELALRSLARQSLPTANFEIIVVDNGSHDSTRAVVAEFEKTIGNIRYIYNESPGLHVGRHQGFREAQGDLLVFIDDDIEAFQTLLSSIKATFENHKVALIGGKCLPKYEGPVPEWLSAMWAPNARGERSICHLSLIDLGELPKPVDPLLVFGYEAVMADLAAWLPLWRPGGSLILHDSGWADGVQRAIREIVSPIQLEDADVLPNMYSARVTYPNSYVFQ
jgi:glycosyltransferase involved in cell wall biosynthesis